MKDALFPAIRASSTLRSEAESLLTEGESLSGFVLSAVQREVERRQHASAFVQLGLQRSREPSGYIDADEVIANLRKRLAKRPKDSG